MTLTSPAVFSRSTPGALTDAPAIDATQSESTDLRHDTSASAAVPRGSPATPRASRTDARTVLVVDDDEAIRTLVRELLADEGYHVLTAEDGAQALETLNAQEADVILLDMRMPVMDGWSFVSAYRERPGPLVPIVVITAATDARRTAAEVGAAGYLGKPFDLDELLDVVERALPPRE